MGKLFAFWIMAALAFIGVRTVSAETISFDHHAVTVIDGDSIQVSGRVIQLQGIDAPELGQACNNDGHYWLCGLSAAYELRRLVGFQISPIECVRMPQDRDITQALCMANGGDIGLVLISSGLAVTTADSPLHYRVAERRAREAALGIWGGAFILPADWRQDKRLPGEHAFGPSAHLHGELPWKIEAGGLTFEPRSEHAACLVKGVIEDGRRVYYGPLDHEYETLQPDTGRGERLFCGDDLARMAGWRRKGEETRIN